MAGSNREEYLRRVAEANKSDRTRISEPVGESMSVFLIWVMSHSWEVALVEAVAPQINAFRTVNLS